MKFNDFVFDECSSVLFLQNKCHHSDWVMSPKSTSSPGAFISTHLRRIKEMKEQKEEDKEKRETCCSGHQNNIDRTEYQVKWSRSTVDMSCRLLCFFFLCLLCPAMANPSAEPTIQQQQQGGLLPFPEGRAPDGTLYKTDYRCEGENMTISCEDSDGPGLHGIISVVRANFGRFSIAICNRHGQTDWSVNCMAPQTTKILQQRCDEQLSCVVPVDSNVFHDACPGTFKYLEAHYACRSSQTQQQNSQSNTGSKRGPPLPPWLFDATHGSGGQGGTGQTTASTNQRRPWANKDHHRDVVAGIKSSVNGGSKSTPPPPQKTNNKNNSSSTSLSSGEEGKKEERRKPILVTEKMDPVPASPTVISTTSTSRRVPITTPKPTTKSSTATTTPASTVSTTTPQAGNDAEFVDKSSATAKMSILSREEDSFASSSPVTTFTISSKYEKEEFGKSFVSSSASSDIESSSSDNSLNGPSITTSCPPVTSRKLQWDWTSVGEIAIQPCPIGATGLAKWNCVDVADASADISSLDTMQNVHPQWYGAQPDMSDCKSVAMSNLEAQVRKEDPENVLISSLSYVTRTKALYGGDLESAVAIMRTVASRVQYRLQSSGSVFHNKESHIRQVLQNVLQSASNILEKSNRRAWLDLRPDRRMKVATSLLLALEESAFLLAGVLNQPTHILETYEILTLAISAVEVDFRENDQENNYSGDVEKVTFPSKRLLYVDDAIELYKNDVAAYGQEGMAEAVFFSYTTLHEILEAGKLNFGGKSTENIKDGDWRLNSRVVSASLGQGRHVELSHPVKVYLRHLVPENMTHAVCVYWDFEVHGWSDEGCRVVASNATMTQCECSHLTNFAVVMKASVPSTTQDLLTSIRLDIVAYIIAAVITLAAFVLLVRFRKRVFQWCQCSGGFRNLFCCCCNLCNRNDKQSHLEKCQSFYTGLSRSSNGNLVMGPNGLQCSTQNNSKTRFFTGPNRAHSQYVLSNQQIMQQHSNTMAPSTTSTSLLTQPLMSSHQTPGSRAHITLNPYSTQLVENINMMMPDKSSGSSSATNSSSSTTSTTLGRNSHQQSCPMGLNPHLINLTTSLRRDSTPMSFHDNSGQPSVINIDPQAINGDVVYRAVSPHGHVYWEIDPNQVYGTNNNRKQIQSMSEENVALLVHNNQIMSPVGYYPHQQYMEEEEQSLLMHHHQQQQQQQQFFIQPQQHSNMQFQHCPSLDNLNADHLNSHTGRIMMATSSSNNLLSHSGGNSFLENGTARKSAFVRTGANRFRHANNNTQQHSKRLTSADRQQQHTVSSVSASIMAQHQQQQQQQQHSSGMVPEQLQTQVQIRDIKPIQVSVKSSEYIEAKIRTLRRGNT